ncbi:MAG: hypothetical protein LAQ69_24770 [Acidobacteriia bacterium]|nr:hypothetical protein [Terriglobia bacterium]
MNQDIAKFLDLGTWIGRGQAFGVIANQAMAAEAECLRQIRDTAAYKTLDLTWDEFCPQCAGISRKHVDDLIHNLEEFGATYFHLSEIVRISPETYRQIAGKVEGEEIEIEGKMVPIVPENAARIRSAVQRMRTQLQDAKKRVLPASCRIGSVNRLVEEGVSELSRISELPLDLDEKATLAGIADYAVRRLTKVCERLRG